MPRVAIYARYSSEGEKRLTVDLIGDLAGILSIATKERRLVIENELSKLQPVNGNDGCEAEAENGDFPETGVIPAMVAGAGFEPATFRL
jgi:site-specific DNA recombinase